MFVPVLSIERKNLNVYLIFTLNIFSSNGVEENIKNSLSQHYIKKVQ